MDREDNRKVLETINNVAMNAVRLTGHKVDDSMYIGEPTAPQQQTWDEMTTNLGVK